MFNRCGEVRASSPPYKVRSHGERPLGGQVCNLTTNDNTIVNGAGRILPPCKVRSHGERQLGGQVSNLPTSDYTIINAAGIILPPISHTSKLWQEKKYPPPHTTKKGLTHLVNAVYEPSFLALVTYGPCT